MLSPDLQRIEHIREYCTAIEQTIFRYGRSLQIFAADGDYQRSVSFSILQIGELSAGLSQAFKEQTASRIQWGPIKGMRNPVAHSYGTMDREIIWETAITDIPVLKAFCDEQLGERSE